MDNLVHINLYELIGVQQTSTLQEIKTAYRKKALSCHPDKNPDNPRAAELFHELSKALEILTDVSARAAYDKVLNAKHLAKLRIKEFDAKRRKFKDELERREEAYNRTCNNKDSFINEEQKFKAEIERLQKEGSRQVEEEIAFVKRKIWEQLNRSESTCPSYYRVKIKWKVVKNDPKNGGYNYEILHRILSKYGDIAALVISTKKAGRAMVEYKSKTAAETAAQIEIGFMNNPLALEGLWNKEAPKVTIAESIYGKSKTAPDIPHNRTADADFESVVLNNLKRAEERKRLLQKLKNEEET